jgi:hypothetical protein
MRIFILNFCISGRGFNEFLKNITGGRNYERRVSVSSTYGVLALSIGVPAHSFGTPSSMSLKESVQKAIS